MIKVCSTSKGVDMTDKQGETSPLREAIAAVLADYDWIEDETVEDMVEQLAGVVEAVPVKVTIRDLDMSPENIVTIPYREVVYLDRIIEHAVETGSQLHFTVDGGFLKVKAGGGMWSAPIETREYEG